ncbi:hypothetical protein BN2476_360050 [Paraburkholderia piptadeniae]|uniref:Uncharacterized protein n=1 Tax=Paraburkholderia piptadeniae TaxID=1701573 RepID=A0A1N7S993_9BURK|nr:hypothetical protein BN2476_360050 [Paraburkholderia piptadeniae]
MVLLRSNRARENQTDLQYYVTYYCGSADTVGYWTDFQVAVAARPGIRLRDLPTRGRPSLLIGLSAVSHCCASKQA